MITTSIAPRRVDIPHEPGQWVELRALGWKEKQKAADAKVAAAMERVAQLPAALASQIAATRQQMAAGAPVAEDPLDTTYDMATLLQLGISAWSYTAAVSPEAIDALDDETARWAARLILAGVKPQGL